jgi:hypothetical protein
LTAVFIPILSISLVSLDGPVWFLERDFRPIRLKYLYKCDRVQEKLSRGDQANYGLLQQINVPSWLTAAIRLVADLRLLWGAKRP